MSNLIVNYKLHGYEEKSILDLKEVTRENDINKVVIILNSDTVGYEHNYYEAVKHLCSVGIKVVLISMENENECFRMLACVMLSYNQYNLYSVKNKSYLSADYVEEVSQRESSYTEVQSYIDGDLVGFSELGTIFIGIESLVKEGNIEALKEFLESRVNSVENIAASIDFLKKNVDINKSDELVGTIFELQSQLDKLEDAKQDTENQLRITEGELKNAKQEAENADEETKSMRLKLESIMEQSSSGGVVVSSYIETNVATLHCRTKIVIYFKEVSYVQYTNSFVNKLLEFYKASEKKAKLIIYDKQTSLSCLYNPLQIVGTQEYLADKNALITRETPFVVVEPNPQIIQDVLTSSASFDIVIIYDRMKEATDIVTGNNVYKFFVVNSVHDLEHSKGTMRISNNSKIITRENSSLISSDVFSINTIAEYKGSDSAKVARYIKLKLNNGKSLFEEFNNVIRFNTI